MTDWRWIGAELLFAIHDRQISEHGGQDGMRDGGAVESALARPRNLAAYGQPDAASPGGRLCIRLGAQSWLHGRQQADAWVAARLFLADNGYRLRFDPADAVKTMEMLAAGTISETELAGWFRRQLQKR